MTTPLEDLVQKLGDFSPINCQRRDETGESLVEQVNRKYDGRHFFAIPRRVLRNDILELKRELQERMCYDTDMVTALATLRDFYYLRKMAEKQRK